MGVGTSSGHVLLFDLRTSEPLVIRDHQYGYRIKDIKFLEEKRIATSDTKIMKIWDRDQSSKIYASIEPPADINDVCLIPQSGLFLMGCEQSKCMSYFVPSLGPAPKWSSFLDALTEELEEDKQSVYDDYKFITREELEKWELTKMIGSEYLKAYMHGFFIDVRLYTKLRAIAEPFEYEKYRKSKIKEKIEKQSAGRIAAKKKMPKVNARTAARLLLDETSKNTGLFEDDRFKELWENEDYKIDEEDDKFKLYHPVPKKITAEDIEEHFEPVEGEKNEGDENLFDDSDLDDEPKQTRPRANGNNNKKGKEIGFYELKPGHSMTNKKSHQEKSLSFGKRVNKISHAGPKNRDVVGDLQMSFIPQSEKNRMRQEQKKKEQFETRRKERRGVGDLKLSKLNMKGSRRR